MDLLKPPFGAVKKRKRVGRGPWNRERQDQYQRA